MPTEYSDDPDKPIGNKITEKDKIEAKIKILMSERDAVIDNIIINASLNNYKNYQEERIKMAQFFKEEIEYMHVLLDRYSENKKN